jgi:hypothetical protein
MTTQIKKLAKPAVRLHFCYDVPDRGHEAMRDLVRAREAAVDARKRARRQLQSFLLRHDRISTS